MWGRGASQKRAGKKKGERITMVMELSQKLGVGTTKLKQLMSISNYAPEYISMIDKGELSVSSAYQRVREQHIKSKKAPGISNDFDVAFRKFLKERKPTLSQINDTLKKTYPYSLELTGSDEDKRRMLKSYTWKDLLVDGAIVTVVLGIIFLIISIFL